MLEERQLGVTITNGLQVLTCSSAGYPRWTLIGHQLGVTTTNGLQVFLSLATVLVTQAGRWRTVSWGSRLQVAFKSSYHWQLCPLPKLNTRAASVGVTTTNGLQVEVDTRAASTGGHDYKWPLSSPTTCNLTGHPSWTVEGHQLGVTTTNAL